MIPPENTSQPSYYLVNNASSNSNRIKFNDPILSVILPVFNEAAIISESIETIDNFLESINLPYEILVCDDCSNDGTYQIVKDLLIKNPNILLLRFNKRLGKGGTIKEAINLTSGKIVIVMDADLPVDLSYMITFINLINAGNSIIIGERSISDRLAQGFLRVILSLAYNVLVNLLFRTNIKDHQCGFKGFRTEIARLLAKDIFNNGFTFDTELIIKAKTLGIPIKTVQVKWNERRPTKHNLCWIKIAPIMMKDLVILKIKGKHTLRCNICE